MVDQTWWQYFNDYNALMTFFGGAINEASTLYSDHSWDSTIGKISIKWVALDVFTSSTDGVWQSFSPDTSKSGLEPWLYGFKTWAISNADFNDFDYGFLFSRDAIGGAVSWTGEICKNYKRDLGVS